MKLTVQIPCLDEAGALPLTLADLPREVRGFRAAGWPDVPVPVPAA